MATARGVVIRAADVTRTEGDGLTTEKAVGGTGVPARELVFGRWVIAPNVNLAAHVHTADTIAFCTRGSCSFTMGPNLKGHDEMGPGDYVFVPAGMVHTESTGPEGVELIFARDRRGGETTSIGEG